MELNFKKGEIYKVEMPPHTLPELKEFDEDYTAYIEWIFMPSGLPGINDVTAIFGFEINCSYKFFVDEWTSRENEEATMVIERNMNAAVEVLRRRGILEMAIVAHKKELSEEFI